MKSIGKNHGQFKSVIFAALLLSLFSPTLLWSAEEKEDSLSSIRLKQTGTGTVRVSFRGEEEPVLSITPVLITAQEKEEPAQLAEGLGQEKDGQVALTQKWRFPGHRVFLHLKYYVEGGVLKLSLKLENGDETEKALAVGIKAEFAAEDNLADRAIFFDWCRAPYVEFSLEEAQVSAIAWEAKDDLNARQGWLAYPVPKGIYYTWGTSECCNPQGSVQPASASIYLPAVCLFPSKGTGGVAAFVDPRSTFRMAGNENGFTLAHTFYLPGEVGFVDEAVETLPGLPAWPYEISFTWIETPDWARVYRTYFETYQGVLQELIAGVKRSPNADHGLVGGWNDYSQIDEHWGQVFNDIGIDYVVCDSVVFERRSGEEILGEETPEIMAMLERRGVTTLTAESTIFMATDTEKSPYPPWFQHWDYNNYPDSLMKTKDGDLMDCWNGKSANTAPEFNFGQDRLKALKERLKVGYKGLYMDIYNSGCGADYAHQYEQFPFYPIPISACRYTAAMRDLLAESGNGLFNINYPHPSLLAGLYADFITYDSDLPLWLQFRAYGDMVRLPTQLWTNKQNNPAEVRSSVSAALAYGVLMGPYGSLGSFYKDGPMKEEEHKQTCDIYRTTQKICHRLIRATIVAGTTTKEGKVGPLIYFRDGNALYVTVHNTAAVPGEFEVPLVREHISDLLNSELYLRVWKMGAEIVSEQKIAPGDLDSVFPFRLDVTGGDTAVLVLEKE